MLWNRVGGRETTAVGGRRAFGYAVAHGLDGCCTPWKSWQSYVATTSTLTVDNCHAYFGATYIYLIVLLNQKSVSSSNYNIQYDGLFDLIVTDIVTVIARQRQLQDNQLKTL